MRIAPILRSPAGTLLRYAFSLALLGWLGTRVDWRQFAALARLDCTWTLPAVLLAGAAYPLQAWRWQILLRAQHLELAAPWVHRATWIGAFYNSFLPGGVAGDAVRLGAVWQAAPEQRAAGAATLLADRFLGLGSLFALAALALAGQLVLRGGNAELHTLLVASAAATGLVLLVGWGAIATRRWEPLSARLLGPERAARLHDAAQALGARPAALVAATLLSIAVWLADFAALWLLAGCAGLAAGPLTITVAAAAAYVAAALPLSIGGHGLREGALVVTLGWLGFGGHDQPGPALLAAALWCLSVGWSAVGGLAFLLPSPAPRK